MLLVMPGLGRPQRLLPGWAGQVAHSAGFRIVCRNLWKQIRRFLPKSGIAFGDFCKVILSPTEDVGCQPSATRVGPLGPPHTLTITLIWSQMEMKALAWGCDPHFQKPCNKNLGLASLEVSAITKGHFPECPHFLL